jgi:hypothetical protein
LLNWKINEGSQKREKEKAYTMQPWEPHTTSFPGLTNNTGAPLDRIAANTAH